MMPRRSAQETSFRRLREDEEEERLIRQQVEEERALQESQHDLLDRIRQYQYQADEADAALHLYAGGTNNVVSKTVSRPAHFAAFPRWLPLRFPKKTRRSHSRRKHTGRAESA